MSEIDRPKEKNEFEVWVDSLDVSDVKKQFLIAYKTLYGNIAASCRVVHVVRQTFYNWKVDDANFMAALEQIEPEEDFMDALEGELRKKALIDKDTTMQIFMAKTKMKSRGYIEGREHIMGASNIEVKITPAKKEGE